MPFRENLRSQRVRVQAYLLLLDTSGHLKMITQNQPDKSTSSLNQSHHSINLISQLHHSINLTTQSTSSLIHITLITRSTLSLNLITHSLISSQVRFPFNHTAYHPLSLRSPFSYSVFRIQTRIRSGFKWVDPDPGRQDYQQKEKKEKFHV
jgi:hypothetical protein